MEDITIIIEEKKDKQITGLSGVYFVAAELLKQDFQVLMTIGNAKSVDLVAIKNNKNFNIQVKTLRKKPNCFTLKISRIYPDYIYIFVYLNEKGKYPDYYILKGQELLDDLKQFFGASIGRLDGRETVNHGPLQPHKDSWDKII